jgi:omega-hydroxy-beta-dihydromenaquinone-9 sulfotransferase
MITPDQASGAKRLRLLRGTWQSLAVKIDPGCSRATRRTRALYWLNGTTQSILHRIQNKSYADALATVVPPAPIFVLGFWRSGTTFLHELLCCDPRFGFPSTYACLNPAHFLLTERWVRRGEEQQVRRPMDDLRYSWSSPQEDEFAMLALGAPSAYEALIVPSLMRDPARLLDLQARSTIDRERWHTTFDYFLKLLTLQQGRTMLLKSPTHGYRMRLLQSKYPDARFVIIERNPYEVFASNLKLWQTLTDSYGLEYCSADQAQDFVLAAYLLHEKTVSEGISHSTPGSVARVRYENMVKKPIEQISHLYTTLKLGDFAEAGPRLETYLDKASAHARNRFRLTRKQKERVDREWGHIIEQKGYSWPDSYIDLE